MPSPSLSAAFTMPSTDAEKERQVEGWYPSNSSSSSSEGFVPPAFVGTWQNILLACVLFVIVTTTIVGNLLVIIAIRTDKHMQTTFNYYVLNLAVTDFLVGLTVMTFYSVDVVFGYWPFGEVMCGVWVFLDYGLTFVSVFTLVAISIDRLWSVSWPIYYQRMHNISKVAVAICIIWLVMIVIWLPPCVLDRVRYSQPHVCIWEPSNNREFVVVVAVLGHHLPDVVLVVSYACIITVMRRRARVGVAVTNPRPMHSLSVPHNDPASTSNGGNGGDTNAAPTPMTISVVSSVASTAADSNATQREGQPPPPPPGGRATQLEQRKQIKERRVFHMLTYILAGYAICWVPFHFVFDISAVSPDSISPALYSGIFYLSYTNSTINPFLYHASNQEFKKAFRRLLGCKGNSVQGNSVLYDMGNMTICYSFWIGFSLITVWLGQSLRF
ncbi:PREDICTED: alpha-2B adrenergic receptor-like [Priapulus caudatus]|uniref:Alpha-2B adrenergic receptor-like n=1 Tax=Priapulus caudatus TaxID=37621 RepID=A0ABM1ECN7_PRICU|nr:PREDICTED: alpha-2B adrenergic receptor-like [Priapulus caudatus]